jgi:hypothetical protein
MARRAFSRGLVTSATVLALAACGRSESARPVAEPPGSQAPESAAPGSSPVVAPPAASSAAPEPSASSAPSAANPIAVPVAIRGLDGSAGPCRAVRGPVELPTRAPATFVVRADRVDVVLDDDGRPRIASFPAGPLAGLSLVSSPPAREPAEGPARGSRLRCATAGEVAFCPDRSGAVHRSGLAGEGSRIVANGRVGARVAASLIGGAHTALAYLASRKTTEGWVSEAWLEVDDDAPLRLSEDGSGATDVDLAARGATLLALSIDARSALTAMHARPVLYQGGARLGEDAVVFVGGPGDRQTAGTLALPSAGSGWALLPIGRDVADFGLAIVRLDDPPRVDEPTVWSMYPNGLDPASVAVVARGAGAWVARVRPQAADPASAHVLELGEVSADGSFTPRDIVPTANLPNDVSLALGPHGDLWLAWVDSSGSWVERLACR